MVFTLRGQQYLLSKEEVEKAMGGVQPVQPIKGKDCLVVVNGQKYPPNQVLYYSLRRQCPGLSLLDFRNDTARNILEQMGFELRADGDS